MNFWIFRLGIHFLVTAAICTAAQQVAIPTFSPVAGTYTSARTVTISSSTSSATIRYTTDGTTPSSTVGNLYSGPISVGSTETVRAIGYKASWTDSLIGTAPYTITGTVANPSFSPAAGTYTSGQTVSINSITPGASIRYTIDGIHGNRVRVGGRSELDPGRDSSAGDQRGNLRWHGRFQQHHSNDQRRVR